MVREAAVVEDVGTLTLVKTQESKTVPDELDWIYKPALALTYSAARSEGKQRPVLAVA